MEPPDLHGLLFLPVLSPSTSAVSIRRSVLSQGVQWAQGQSGTLGLSLLPSHRVDWELGVSVGCSSFSKAEPVLLQGCFHTAVFDTAYGVRFLTVSHSPGSEKQARVNPGLHPRPCVTVISMVGTWSLSYQADCVLYDPILLPCVIM